MGGGGIGADSLESALVVSPRAIARQNRDQLVAHLAPPSANEQGKTFEILNAAICAYGDNKRWPRERGDHPKLDKELVCVTEAPLCPRVVFVWLRIGVPTVLGVTRRLGCACCVSSVCVQR